jgi:hypothetical protein
MQRFLAKRRRVLWIIFSEVIAYLLPPFLLVFFNVDLSKHATELVRKVHEEAHALTMIEVQAWLFIIIAGIWAIYLFRERGSEERARQVQMFKWLALS